MSTTHRSTAEFTLQKPLPDLPSTSTLVATPTTATFHTRPHASTTAALRRPAPSSRPSTVGIRRLPSTQRIPCVTFEAPSANHAITEEEETGGRRRSTSAPQPVTRARGTSDPSRRRNRASQMASIDEAGGVSTTPHTTSQARPSWFTRRLPSQSTISTLGLQGEAGRESAQKQQLPPMSYEYNTNIVDLLDVLDPEVSTLSTLNNVQNSLFVPDLGRFLNRRPTYELSSREAGAPNSSRPNSRRKTVGTTEKTEKRSRPNTINEEEETLALEHILSQKSRNDNRASLHTISSRLSDSHFAVLPHGLSLEDWSEQDKAELNDHVRHLLHSRREKFKRSMRGFKKYVSKPLGFFVTLYAFLITVFGLIWVLFLIGWISGGDKHSYDINVIDLVLVGLFAIVGDGLAPFRCVDTYHMAFIAYYARLEWRLRKKKNLPALPNPNDLPTDPTLPTDLESGHPPTEIPTTDEIPLPLALTSLQQRRLAHHQTKFAKSHTFYKPHETATHHAFSIRLLITIVALLDGHSAFQIALGGCTWGIDYRVRPESLTTVILCCSLACNITAGILISVGDKRSRKKDVLERMFRQELTEEALRSMKERRGVVPVEVDGAGNGDGSRQVVEESSAESSFEKKRGGTGGEGVWGREAEEEEKEEEEEVRSEVKREHGGTVRDFAVRGAGVE